jgi:hypothetical protein
MTAATNIKCYKVVFVNNGKHFTPCQNKKLSRLVLWGITKFKPDNQEQFFKYAVNGVTGVTSGFIHTFSTLISAFIFVEGDFKKKAIPECYEIYECIIPKGTLFHSGMSNDYASKCIRFKRKLKTNVLVA